MLFPGHAERIEHEATPGGWGYIQRGSDPDGDWGPYPYNLRKFCENSENFPKSRSIAGRLNGAAA
jgi:hypothetical protein